jgi:hypothetical protein
VFQSNSYANFLGVPRGAFVHAGFQAMFARSPEGFPAAGPAGGRSRSCVMRHMKVHAHQRRASIRTGIRQRRALA